MRLRPRLSLALLVISLHLMARAMQAANVLPLLLCRRQPRLPAKTEVDHSMLHLSVVQRLLLHV